MPYSGYYPDAESRIKRFKKLEKVVEHIGYYPSKMLGLGEDVPAEVGLETVRLLIDKSKNF